MLSIKFQNCFVQAFKIVVDSRKFSVLLLYILWDDWPIFIISDSKEQLQQQFEYTLLKPDCHSWWISKMQSGREEERYAIKFCFKLGKNDATETHGMLHTAFGASCMNRSSVFEWHKRIKEHMGSVRDDERCGRSKEINTPELICRRVSIETISAQFDVSVWTVHTIIREELKICATFVPRVLREDQKERRCHDSREMVELINSDPAGLDAMLISDESWIYCYDPETKRQSSQWKHAGSPRPKNATQSKSTHKALASCTRTGFPLDRQSTRNTMLKFKGSSGRYSFGRGQHSSNRVSGISTKTMHLSTTPSLWLTIWPRWTSRRFHTLFILQNLLPETFSFSLSSRKNFQAVVMRQLMRWKRL